MKRILSIAISMLLISNIFGVALLADAAEETCYQDAAVGLNPPVTNDFDIGLDPSTPAPRTKENVSLCCSSANSPAMNGCGS